MSVPPYRFFVALTRVIKLGERGDDDHGGDDVCCPCHLIILRWLEVKATVREW